RPDGEDLLALDQDVGLGEVAHLRVHRHHGSAANDVAPSMAAAVRGRVSGGRRRRARREQIAACGDGSGRGRHLQEIATRCGMALRNSFVAQYANELSSALTALTL